MFVRCPLCGSDRLSGLACSLKACACCKLGVFAVAGVWVIVTDAVVGVSRCDGMFVMIQSLGGVCMPRILILGNSGSGKSTLAQRLATRYAAGHLDLDSLAWLPTDPPQRAPLDTSLSSIHAFIAAHPHWVIEGCYTDLLRGVAADADALIFLNLSVDACVANARQRPWEPHKYASKAAQDANLAMLLDWIRDYPIREGVFSLAAHQAFFDVFTGKKTMLTDNISFDDFDGFDGVEQ